MPRAPDSTLTSSFWMLETPWAAGAVAITACRDQRRVRRLNLRERDAGLPASDEQQPALRGRLEPVATRERRLHGERHPDVGHAADDFAGRILGGATPMTVNGMRLTVMARPMMLRSPANRRCQYA